MNFEDGVYEEAETNWRVLVTQADPQGFVMTPIVDECLHTDRARWFEQGGRPFDLDWMPVGQRGEGEE